MISKINSRGNSSHIIFKLPFMDPREEKIDKYNLIEYLIRKFEKKEELPSPFYVLFFFSAVIIFFTVVVYWLTKVNPRYYMPPFVASFPIALILLFAPFYERKTYIFMHIYLYIIVVILGYATTTLYIPAIIGFIFIGFLLAATELLHRAIAYRRLILAQSRRRQQTLEAVMFVAETLLKSTHWEHAIPQILKRIGEATKVSRIYIFKNSIKNDEVFMNQVFEWHPEGTPSQMENPLFQNLSYTRAHLTRWKDKMEQHEPIVDTIDTLPAHEREILIHQGVSSFAIVPIYSRDKWWGFMGLGIHDHDVLIIDDVISVLKTAANIIGYSIYRDEVNEELQERNKDLERANKLMVNRELTMIKLKEELKNIKNASETI